MDKKFLGICIVVASLIVSGTLLYISLFADAKDRYKVAGSRVFDTQEGKFIDPENMSNISSSAIQSETSNNSYQTLDNSVITYKVSIPGQDGNTDTGILTQRNIKITASNTSLKYNVKYLEIEIKLYKDDILFLKDEQIIGDKEEININPLSSYDINYYIGLKTKYPNKPWKSEITTKTVKGVALE